MTESPERRARSGRTAPRTLLDVFDGRDQLVVYKHMFHTGKPFEDQCEGCTITQWNFQDATYLNEEGVSYAVLCEGPFEESNRYRQFMGWDMPWYSVPSKSADALIAGRHFGMRVCYLRAGDRVFETYWDHWPRPGNIWAAPTRCWT